MGEPELDRILRHTLADFRMSRGERRVLRQTFRELGASPHDLAVLRSQAFEIAREELVGPQAVAVVDWLEEAVKVLDPPRPQAERGPQVLFSPGDDCPGKIAGLFRRAADRVDVCVFTITDDRISEAILKAHRGGVAVRILTDDEKSADRGSDIERLARAGVPVRLDRSEYHMHHKFAVFDGRTAVTGSYNWTRSAAEHNAENLVVTHQPSLCRAFSAAFERLWEQWG